MVFQEEGKNAIIKKLEDINLGSGKVNYRLRDWLSFKTKILGCSYSNSSL